MMLCAAMFWKGIKLEIRSNLWMLNGCSEIVFALSDQKSQCQLSRMHCILFCNPFANYCHYCMQLSLHLCSRCAFRRLFLKTVCKKFEETWNSDPWTSLPIANSGAEYKQHSLPCFLIGAYSLFGAICSPLISNLHFPEAAEKAS